jgi:hypothetical protein
MVGAGFADGWHLNCFTRSAAMALVLTTWWGGPDFGNAFSITCCCLDYHPTRHPIFGFNAL